MFEEEAKEEINKEHWNYSIFKDLAQEYWQKGAEFGYNKALEGNKTSYIKGMRHLANALKEYDRIFGAWTDYFEHTVDKVLKQELEKE